MADSRKKSPSESKKEGQFEKSLDQIKKEQEQKIVVLENASQKLQDKIAAAYGEVDQEVYDKLSEFISTVKGLRGRLKKYQGKKLVKLINRIDGLTKKADEYLKIQIKKEPAVENQTELGDIEELKKDIKGRMEYGVDDAVASLKEFEAQAADITSQERDRFSRFYNNVKAIRERLDSVTTLEDLNKLKDELEKLDSEADKLLTRINPLTREEEKAKDKEEVSKVSLEKSDGTAVTVNVGDRISFYNKNTKNIDDAVVIRIEDNDRFIIDYQDGRKETFRSFKVLKKDAAFSNLTTRPRGDVEEQGGLEEDKTKELTPELEKEIVAELSEEDKEISDLRNKIIGQIDVLRDLTDDKRFKQFKFAAKKKRPKVDNLILDFIRVRGDEDVSYEGYLKDIFEESSDIKSLKKLSGDFSKMVERAKKIIEIKGRKKQEVRKDVPAEEALVKYLSTPLEKSDDQERKMAEVEAELIKRIARLRELVDSEGFSIDDAKDDSSLDKLLKVFVSAGKTGSDMEFVKSIMKTDSSYEGLQKKTKLLDDLITKAELMIRIKEPKEDIQEGALVKAGATEQDLGDEKGGEEEKGVENEEELRKRLLDAVIEIDGVIKKRSFNIPVELHGDYADLIRQFEIFTVSIKEKMPEVFVDELLEMSKAAGIKITELIKVYENFAAFARLVDKHNSAVEKREGELIVGIRRMVTALDSIISSPEFEVPVGDSEVEENLRDFVANYKGKDGIADEIIRRCENTKELLSSYISLEAMVDKALEIVDMVIKVEDEDILDDGVAENVEEVTENHRKGMVFVNGEWIKKEDFDPTKIRDVIPPHRAGASEFKAPKREGGLDDEKLKDNLRNIIASLEYITSLPDFSPPTGDSPVEQHLRFYLENHKGNEDLANLIIDGAQDNSELTEWFFRFRAMAEKAGELANFGAESAVEPERAPHGAEATFIPPPEPRLSRGELKDIMDEKKQVMDEAQTAFNKISRLKRKKRKEAKQVLEAAKAEFERAKAEYVLEGVNVYVEEGIREAEDVAATQYGVRRTEKGAFGKFMEGFGKYWRMAGNANLTEGLSRSYNLIYKWTKKGKLNPEKVDGLRNLSGGIEAMQSELGELITRQKAEEEAASDEEKDQLVEINQALLEVDGLVGELAKQSGAILKSAQKKDVYVISKIENLVSALEVAFKKIEDVLKQVEDEAVMEKYKALFENAVAFINEYREDIDKAKEEKFEINKIDNWWVKKALQGGRFLGRFVSAKMAIGSLVLGAGGAAAYAGVWLPTAGAATAVGTGEALRQRNVERIQRRIENTVGKIREGGEGLANLPIDELGAMMGTMQYVAELDGMAVEDKNFKYFDEYNSLREQYKAKEIIRRIELINEGVLTANEDVDKELDNLFKKSRKWEKTGEWGRRMAAGVVGVAVGTGVVGKAFGETVGEGWQYVKSLFGSVEAADMVGGVVPAAEAAEPVTGVPSVGPASAGEEFYVPYSAVSDASDAVTATTPDTAIGATVAGTAATADQLSSVDMAQTAQLDTSAAVPGTAQSTVGVDVTQAAEHAPLAAEAVRSVATDASTGLAGAASDVGLAGVAEATAPAELDTTIEPRTTPAVSAEPAAQMTREPFAVPEIDETVPKVEAVAGQQVTQPTPEAGATTEVAATQEAAAPVEVPAEAPVEATRDQWGNQYVNRETINRGEGVLHAVNRLQDSFEGGEEALADTIREGHPEWAGRSDEGVIRRWRVEQLRNMGFEIREDGWGYPFSVRTGAEVEMFLNEDGYPEVRLIAEPGEVSINENYDWHEHIGERVPVEDQIELMQPITIPPAESPPVLMDPITIPPAEGVADVPTPAAPEAPEAVVEAAAPTDLPPVDRDNLVGRVIFEQSPFGDNPVSVADAAAAQAEAAVAPAAAPEAPPTPDVEAVTPDEPKGKVPETAPEPPPAPQEVPTSKAAPTPTAETAPTTDAAVDVSEVAESGNRTQDVSAQTEIAPSAEAIPQTGEVEQDVPAADTGAVAAEVVGPEGGEMTPVEGGVEISDDQFSGLLESINTIEASDPVGESIGEWFNDTLRHLRDRGDLGKYFTEIDGAPELMIDNLLTDFSNERLRSIPNFREIFEIYYNSPETYDTSVLVPPGGGNAVKFFSEGGQECFFFDPENTYRSAPGTRFGIERVSPDGSVAPVTGMGIDENGRVFVDAEEVEVAAR